MSHVKIPPPCPANFDFDLPRFYSISTEEDREVKEEENEKKHTNEKKREKTFR